MTQAYRYRYATRKRRPPKDRLGREIKAGDMVSVQQAGTFEVREQDGELVFEPYNRGPELVRHYFMNDLEIVQ